MEDAELHSLENEQNSDNLIRIINHFVENNAQTFSFEELNKSGQKQRIFNAIFKILESQELAQCYVPSLDLLRIISRDKTGLTELVDNNRLKVLLKHAGIIPGNSNDDYSVDVVTDANHNAVLAALKVLCNLTFNSTALASQLASSKAANGILARVRLYREHPLPQAVKKFDMMLLFLITALVSDVREKVRKDFHGLTYLTEALDLVLKESSGKLTDDEVDLICQILKVLFNLLARRTGIGEIVSGDEVEDETLCLRLTAILHDLLIAETTPAKKDQLRSNVVDMLTTMPITCYSELIPQHQTDDDLECEGRSMVAMQALVDFLGTRLAPADTSKRKQEMLSPLLTVLVQLSRKQRLVRKFLKSRVLPPLRDVMTRPETGDSLRAGLCRLLTSPSAIVKDLAADFLFVLCKENVARMIKYTGYGNAAGLFANRGLMCGRPNSSSSSYSSDSDSETEEYAALSDKINPVIGCYEPPTKSVLASMTEEQKEYEAIKLVSMMDKLSREGVIQPCRIGEDGRPKPVEHVLELQESLPKDQVRASNSNCD